MKNSKTKSSSCQPKFLEGEKILCYHGTFIYEAKCIKFEKMRSNEFQYFVHYSGWNKNWDEWVPAKRILKFNSENLKKQQQLKTDSKRKLANSKKTAKQKEDCSSSSSSTCSAYETVNSFNLAERNGCRTRKRSHPDELKSDTIENNKKICVMDLNLNQLDKINNLECTFKNRILMPENLRILLIDDFDFIIQQNRIVQLPSKKSVVNILNEYIDYKLNKGYLDEWDHIDENKLEEHNKYAEKLNETVNGLIRYFNIMLGSQLLYKFERLQYSDMLNLKKPMSEIYGPIHFVRLI
ncbi:unnamed protein product, partial [Brachionus calyciflorus]